MNRDEVLSELILKDLKCGVEHYDASYHTFRCEGMFYFHLEGWFTNQELRQNSIIRSCLYGESYDDLMDVTEQQLLQLGFIRIPELDWQ